MLQTASQLKAFRKVAARNGDVKITFESLVVDEFQIDSFRCLDIETFESVGMEGPPSDSQQLNVQIGTKNDSESVIKQTKI